MTEYYKQIPPWHEMWFNREVERFVEHLVHKKNVYLDQMPNPLPEVALPNEPPEYQFNGFNYSIYGYVRPSGYQDHENLEIILYDHNVAARRLNGFSGTSKGGMRMKNFREYAI
jgi:hypothetical protein